MYINAHMQSRDSKKFVDNLWTPQTSVYENFKQTKRKNDDADVDDEKDFCNNFHHVRFL